MKSEWAILRDFYFSSSPTTLFFHFRLFYFFFCFWNDKDKLIIIERRITKKKLIWSWNFFYFITNKITLTFLFHLISVLTLCFKTSHHFSPPLLFLVGEKEHLFVHPARQLIKNFSIKTLIVVDFLRGLKELKISAQQWRDDSRNDPTYLINF